MRSRIILGRGRQEKLELSGDLHLTEPAVRPSTIRFWKRSTRTISGKALTTTPAASRPHGISYAKAPLSVATPTVKVFALSRFMKVRANMNSFQQKDRKSVV